jgi:hypothetical protein
MCSSSYHRYRYEDRRRPRRTVSDPITMPGDTRVSDRERNRVIELLKQHTADGRLTLEEFGARVDEAPTARTGNDLLTVLRDLPVPARARQATRTTLPVRPSMLRLPVLALAVILICLAVGHLLLWPLLLVAFFCSLPAIATIDEITGTTAGRRASRPTTSRRTSNPAPQP